MALRISPCTRINPRSLLPTLSHYPSLLSSSSSSSSTTFSLFHHITPSCFTIHYKHTHIVFSSLSLLFSSHPETRKKHKSVYSSVIWIETEREKMGRSPCCEKAHTNKGAWTKEEDQRLISYIKAHGEGCWRSLPKAAGLFLILVSQLFFRT